jgi:hypothetical protein
MAPFTVSTLCPKVNYFAPSSLLGLREGGERVGMIPRDASLEHALEQRRRAAIGTEAVAGRDRASTPKFKFLIVRGPVYAPCGTSMRGAIVETPA